MTRYTLIGLLVFALVWAVIACTWLQTAGPPGPPGQQELVPATALGIAILGLLGINATILLFGAITRRPAHGLVMRFSRDLVPGGPTVPIGPVAPAGPPDVSGSPREKRWEAWCLCRQC